MDDHYDNNSEHEKKENNKDNHQDIQNIDVQTEELEKKNRPILPKIEVLIPKSEKSKIIVPEVKKMEELTSKSTEEYNKAQKVVSAIFYVFIVIASLVSLGGVVWTLADIFIGTTGKFTLFLDLNLGWQIAIIGGLLAGLFFLLVFFFGLFKKSSRSLIKFIYKKRELEEKYKKRIDVKIAAGGLLISLIGIIIGTIFALIWDIFTGSSGDSFSILSLLGSTGPWVLFVGMALSLLIGAALFLIYFWKNGYYLILRILGVLEKENN